MALKLLPEDLSDVPPHLADRYEAQAGRYWDLFYRRNTTKFFKDRHYLHKEFPALAAGPATLLEVGCGVGNTVFPLLEINPQLRIFCCDFAASAIDLVRQNPLYDASGSGAVHAFVADITSDNLAAPAAAGGCGVPEAGCDIATMIFVLSAIHPQRMAAAVHNVARCLRPGSGRLLFRDYAEGDLAQERLAGGDRPKRLGANFYVRGDGTRCYYFSQPEVLTLFASAGFVCDSITLHERTVVNHKRDIAMDRRWIQAIFTLREYRPPLPLPLETLLAQPPPQHSQHHNYPPQPWQLPPSPPPPQGSVAETPLQDGAQEDGAGAQIQCPAGEEDAGTTDVGPCGMDLEEDGGAAGPTAAAGQERMDAAAASSSSPPPPGPPLPGLMVPGSWLTGAAGRLASHLAAGPGQPSGRALLPDSLDSADDLAAELSPSPNHPTNHHPNHPNHHSNHHQPTHLQHVRHSSGPSSSPTSSSPSPAANAAVGPAAVCFQGARHQATSLSEPQQPHQQQQHQQAAQWSFPGHQASGAQPAAACGHHRPAVGDGNDMEVDGTGRSLETELEAEFFATIGRDSAEVVAEEVAAAGAALSRVRLADVSEVAAARLAAAAVAAAAASGAGGGCRAGDSSNSNTRGIGGAAGRAAAQTPPTFREGSAAPPQQQQHGPGGPVVGPAAAAVAAEEAEVSLAQGVSFRCLCRVVASPSTGVPVPDVPPTTLALARVFLASPRLMAGRFALQLGPCRNPAAAAEGGAAAALPAMAAVRSSARRVVLSAPAREGLAAAAADLRRNAHRLVIERVRMAPLDWAAAGSVAGSPAGSAAAAAAAATGAAGYTYVSGAVRQLRDLLQMQPTGYDIVYGADLLAEVTSAATAAVTGAPAAAGEAAIAAARGLFEAAAQLVSPGGGGGGGGSGGGAPQRAVAGTAPGSAAANTAAAAPGRLLLLCFPGAWAAANGMGFAALAGVCGWELLVPEQLSSLYGIDAGPAAEAGCTVMGFRRRG